MRLPGTPQTTRLPASAHTDRPWRIHELTRDFHVEDVWALPTPGGPEDFALLVEGFAEGDPAQSPSLPAKVLWAVRWAAGKALGWDDDSNGIGARVHSLRERMGTDLRDARSGPRFDSLPFRSLYLLDDEWAAEIANGTVHGVMHVGWVPDGAGGWRGQMAVLVKPNGLLGDLYMAAIRPFRYAVVYPQMMKQIERSWTGRAAARRAPA
ncbi:MAG TPA: DUF2867 domain-containing protein [Solirubrobacteraceae bacterium]|nr:DUF2867 domain-containing protein [Solirubrobacteraceae bacterium]